MSAIRHLPDIPFAAAPVGWSSGRPRLETLALDAWLPAEPGPPRPQRLHPALVLAFGGAFRRGSKEDDAFPAANASGGNTAIAEYGPGGSLSAPSARVTSGSLGQPAHHDGLAQPA